MAEIALRILQPHCLEHRIPAEATLKSELVAWEYQRNVEQVTIDWRFSVSDARQKLEQLYPSLSS